ncbi:recombinase RecT [Azospirillum brasilense]|uniref:recombinase RecT n=1 Tax=Azospirillum brasilense TaxID=192 RepID=UPI000E69E860|nr:recombinase RecT [Azospirillum brasilense]NUB24648.1 recombinase RecT [Azospirillum brasilense]NUB35173.1 recombinase RecT [Azospirillum brasilense]RIW07713.1 recombinase RecT [Azospirillum brasilense]
MATVATESAGKPPQIAAPRSPEDIRKAGRLVARQAGGGTVAAFFEANKDAIKAVLPTHMTPDRMLKIALRALRTTPKLMECTIESLFGAVISCAQLGLEPNTPQGHIYLIPFKTTKKVRDERNALIKIEVYEVQVVIGYKGLVELARRSGEIETIAARVAYKGDDFSVEYGTADSITHKPNLNGKPGAPLGVYAVAKLKGGGYQFEWMSLEQVNAIRDESQGYKTAKRFNSDKNPWITNWEEMARKTVIRRLCKYLPMSVELAAAAALEGRAERGETQGLSQVLEGTEYNVLDTVMDSEDAPDPLEESGEAETGQPQLEHKPEPAMPMQQVDARTAETVSEGQPAPSKAAPPSDAASLFAAT